MPRSRTIFIAVDAAAIGFTAGFSWGLSTARRAVNPEENRGVVDQLIEANEQLLLVQKENNNLRLQIEVLEQMVETLNAEIEEINAVMDRPPSS